MKMGPIFEDNVPTIATVATGVNLGVVTGVITDVVMGVITNVVTGVTQIFLFQICLYKVMERLMCSYKQSSKIFIVCINNNALINGCKSL